MAEFDVKCDDCNALLDADFKNNVLFIESCIGCIEGARQEGYKSGHDDGYEEAEALGEP